MKKSLKWALIGTVIVVASLFVYFAIVNGKDSTESKEQVALTKVTVRLSWLIDASAAGYVIAAEHGIYKKYGLEVNIKPGGIDLPPIKLVASGSGEFGQESGAETIMIARNMNIPVKAIASWQPGGAPAIITLADRGIKTPKDLIGKRVGVGYGKPVEYVYRALLEHEGVDRSKISESVFKFDISPLLDGRIDAFTGFKVNQPFVIESKGFKPYVIDPQDYGIRTFGITLFCTDSYLKEHADIVQNFVNATKEGWDYAFANPEEAIDVCMKYQGSDELQYDRDVEVQKLNAYFRTSKTEGKPLGWMDESIWGDMATRLANYKITDKKVDTKTVFTNKFIQDGKNE